MDSNVYQYLLSANPESTRFAAPGAIPLNTGSPDFEVDGAVKEAIDKAVRDTTYLTYPPTAGLDSLRESIAEFHAQHLHIPHKKENILITHGAMQALSVTCSALVGPLETVLLPKAYWFHFPNIIRQTGAEITEIPTTDKTGFKLTPDLLLESIESSTNPTLLILTNPNNPAGTVFTPKELDGLVDVLRHHPSIRIISDEVYNLLLPDRAGDPGIPVCPSIGSYSEIGERVFTINSLSKNYVMSGLRVGYVAADESYLGDKGILTARLRFSTLGVNPYLQEGALAASKATERILSSLRKKLRDRRDRGAELLRTIPNITFIPPEAGYYFAVNISKYKGYRTPKGERIADDVALTKYLEKEGQVLVVAGTPCGTPDYLRLTFAVKEDVFKAGIEGDETRRVKGIRQALKDLKP